MLCEPPAAAPRHSLSHVRAPAFTRTRTRKHTHALHSARTHRRTTSGGAVCVCASVGAWASAPGSVHALDELMDSSVSGFCQASSQASAATFTAGASAPACMRWGAHAHACMHACMHAGVCVHYRVHAAREGVCACVFNPQPWCVWLQSRRAWAEALWLARLCLARKVCMQQRRSVH